METREQTRPRKHLPIALAALALALLAGLLTTQAADQPLPRAAHMSAAREPQSNMHSLKRQNAALRSRLRARPAGRDCAANDVYAYTPEEARAKVTEELLAEQGGAPQLMPTQLSELGLCRGPLRESEIAAISGAFDLSDYVKPELGLAFTSSSASPTADREKIASVLGPDRYREVESECQAQQQDFFRQEREAAIVTLSAYLGMSPELTESIRGLAAEKALILAQAESGPSDPARDLAESTQESLDEQAALQEQKNDELSRRFRDLLGQQLWERYKQAVLLRRPDSDGFPILHWAEGPLFSLPSDEAPGTDEQP